MRALTRLLLVLQALWLGACATTVQVDKAPPIEPEKAALAVEQPGRAWWQLRFRLVWPEGEYPDFSRHLLIAEQLLLPAIMAHEQQLALWRFHRRAARDAAGHQFSLIFYTDAETAAQINHEISTDPLTLWLIDQSMIEKTAFNKRTRQELGLLEQTSDPEWPMAIQRSWPYFIMGASQSWLMLVQEISQDAGLEGNVSYSRLLSHYQQVDRALNARWEEYGQHAYLHHLNAIFGYHPLRIRGSVMRRF